MKYLAKNDDKHMMKIGQKITGIVARLVVKTRRVNVASLRGAELFSTIFAQPGRAERLKINGLDLTVTAYHLNGRAAAKLGISPVTLRGGAEIQVLTKEDYKRYCATFEADPEVLAGVYAPAGKKELYRLMQGAQPMLSRANRKILVPEDASALTLCHEILHDFYLNQNLWALAEERIGFSRLVVSQIYREAITAPDSEAMKFFAGVAARCAEPFDLARITKTNVPEILATRRNLKFLEDTQIFIGEIFAYGASMAILSRLAPGYSEEGLGKVPEELRIYFERTIMNPDLQG